MTLTGAAKGRFMLNIFYLIVIIINTENKYFTNIRCRDKKRGRVRKQ